MFRIQLVLVSVALFASDVRCWSLLPIDQFRSLENVVRGSARPMIDEQANNEAVFRIDRTSGNVVRGSAIPMIDYTAFQVSQKVSLTAFDVAAMYEYYPRRGEALYPFQKTLKVTIQKMRSLDVEDAEREDLYYKRLDALKSEDGTKVQLESAISLDPESFYVIKLSYFGVDRLFYKEDLQIGELSGSTSNGDAFTVNFHQKNSPNMLQDFIKPYYSADKLDYDISNGLVKCLYFKSE